MRTGFLALLSLARASSTSGMLCFCQGHCPSGAANGTCEARPGARCFAAVEELFDHATGKVVVEWTAGCMPPEDEGGTLQCQAHLVPHVEPKSIACCSDGDLCNRGLLTDYKPVTDGPDEHSNEFGLAGLDHMTTLVLLLTVIVALVLFIAIVTCVYLHYRKKEDRHRKRHYAPTSDYDPEALRCCSLSDVIEQSSGSGVGVPMLTQRTIARQLRIEEKLGAGRFGQVWRARWRGDCIAAKIFYPKDEAMWFRESDIFQTFWLRHENILGFIAADIRAVGGEAQMLLLTMYHENGSLYDFLKRTPIDATTMLRMCHSLLSGLCHLHSDISGTRGKPAIAHRDIKSTNILVKKDLECAIADFGLAVKYNKETDTMETADTSCCAGTIRYMAPEVLTQTLFEKKTLDAFLAADMYSTGLVIWEILRRTETGEKHTSVDDYQPPYFEYVNADPSLEEMKEVVCAKAARPMSSGRWQTCDVLCRVEAIMAECWYTKPSSRLSSRLVRKKLADVMALDDGHVVGLEAYSDKDKLQIL